MKGAAEAKLAIPVSAVRAGKEDPLTITIKIDRAKFGDARTEALIRGIGTALCGVMDESERAEFQDQAQLELRRLVAKRGGA